MRVSFLVQIRVMGDDYENDPDKLFLFIERGKNRFIYITLALCKADKNSVFTKVDSA